MKNFIEEKKKEFENKYSVSEMNPPMHYWKFIEDTIWQTAMGVIVSQVNELIAKHKEGYNKAA